MLHYLRRKIISYNNPIISNPSFYFSQQLVLKKKQQISLKLGGQKLFLKKVKSQPHVTKQELLKNYRAQQNYRSYSQTVRQIFSDIDSNKFQEAESIQLLKQIVNTGHDFKYNASLAAFLKLRQYLEILPSSLYSYMILGSIIQKSSSQLHQWLFETSILGVNLDLNIFSQIGKGWAYSTHGQTKKWKEHKVYLLNYVNDIIKSERQQNLKSSQKTRFYLSLSPKQFGYKLQRGSSGELGGGVGGEGGSQPPQSSPSPPWNKNKNSGHHKGGFSGNVYGSNNYNLYRELYENEIQKMKDKKKKDNNQINSQNQTKISDLQQPQQIKSKDQQVSELLKSELQQKQTAAQKAQDELNDLGINLKKGKILDREIVNEVQTTQTSDEEEQISSHIFFLLTRDPQQKQQFDLQKRKQLHFLKAKKQSKLQDKMILSQVKKSLKDGSYKLGKKKRPNNKTNLSPSTKQDKGQKINFIEDIMQVAQVYKIVRSKKWWGKAIDKRKHNAGPQFNYDKFQRMSADDGNTDQFLFLDQLDSGKKEENIADGDQDPNDSNK